MSDPGSISRRQDNSLPGVPHNRAIRRSPPAKPRRRPAPRREARAGKWPATRGRLQKPARHRATPSVIIPLPPLSLYRRVWLT